MDGWMDGWMKIKFEEFIIAIKKREKREKCISLLDTLKKLSNYFCHLSEEVIRQKCQK